MGTLYIISTPIGNLEDITLRALRVLKEADLILCEDTRVTGKLLSHYGIRAPTLSYHQHSRLERVGEIARLLAEGKNLALVTDAGTPGISDPGNELVAEIVRQMRDVKVVPIPGPSALTAVASIAGFPMDRFTFFGFPPAKKGRKKFFEQIAQSEYPVVFYESPYRILKSLSELQTIRDTKYQIQDTRVVVGRELTKKFEKVYRGTIAEVMKQLGGQEARGEFVVVVGPVRSKKLSVSADFSS